jgi:hypothetical protein
VENLVPDHVADALREAFKQKRPYMGSGRSMAD